MRISSLGNHTLALLGLISVGPPGFCRSSTQALTARGNHLQIQLQVSIPLPPHSLSPGQLGTTVTSKPPMALLRSTYFHTMHLQSPFFICLRFKCQFSLFNQNTSRHKLHKSHSDPQMWCRGSTPGESSPLQAETGAQSHQDFNHQQKKSQFPLHSLAWELP